jgi:hypothetical protein
VQIFLNSDFLIRGFMKCGFANQKNLINVLNPGSDKNYLHI